MLTNLRPAFVITRREIRDQFRDWRIIAPTVVLTLFFPALMNIVAEQVIDFMQRYGANIIGDRLVPFLLMVVGFFPISVTLVIALESFVGEKERRSLEPLLSSPLTDFQLYIGKLLAVTLPPLLASFMAIIVYLIGVYRQLGWKPEPVLLTQVVLLTIVQAILMVSGAVIISSQTTSTRAANLLASFIIVPVAILLIAEPEMIIKNFFNREDKQDMYECIMSTPHPQETLENVRNSIRAAAIPLEKFQNSGFRCIIRDNDRSIEQTFREIEEHFHLV